jgi:hypothetical protein
VCEKNVNINIKNIAEIYCVILLKNLNLIWFCACLHHFPHVNAGEEANARNTNVSAYGNGCRHQSNFSKRRNICLK